MKLSAWVEIYPWTTQGNVYFSRTPPAPSEIIGVARWFRIDVDVPDLAEQLPATITEVKE